MRRGAQNGAQLGDEQRGIFFINTHRAVAKERVVLRWNIQVIHRLITADIHGADDNATSVGGLQRLTENIVELALARLAGAVHIQHFGAEQTNCFRAVAKGRLRFDGVSDVGRHFQTNAVGAARLFIQPHALLFANSGLNARFLLVVAGDGFVRCDNNRSGVAIEIDRLVLPRRQRVNFHANKGGNVE